MKSKGFIFILVVVMLLSTGIAYYLSNYGTNIIKVLKSEDVKAEASPSKIKPTGEDGFNDKININTATKSDLTTLPYISDEIADEIISQRTEYAPFDNIDQLRGVSGMNGYIFEKIKNFIRV